MNVTATGTANGDDEQSLASDMLDVHGPKAAVVARDNARAAALAGQSLQARSWIRVLGLIQQRGPIRTKDSMSGSSDPRQIQLKDNGNVYFPDQQQFQQMAEASPVEQ